jgi:antitoxin component of RelBE/YafQ-DinJ toxin-antitoxin module
MPPPPAASALQKRLRQRKQQQVARKAVALSPEPEAADAQHASRGAADLAPPEDDTDGYMLHVRGVGGALEDEDRLKHVFSEFGGVMQATVRHRIADDGRNTSWALVTMTDKRAVEKALAAGARLHGQSGVTLSRFSKKQASESTGGMGQVRLESAAKMIQAKFRQKQAWEQAILKSMGIEVSTAVNTSILAKRWAKKSGLGAKLQRKKVARKAVALSPEPEAADAQHASRVAAERCSRCGR